MISSSPKVIYIAGYGRSGSTILDILLSQEEHVFGAGELHFLFQDWSEPNRHCSCGERYPDCPFWGDLSDVMDIEASAKVISGMEQASQLQNIVEGLVSPGQRRRYEEIQHQLFYYIQEKASCEFIVDSSKTKPEMAARPLAISRLTQTPLSMVHLVRDGRTTVQTILKKGSNWAAEGHIRRKRFPLIRTAYGWKTANQYALDHQQWLRENEYSQMKYEDLMQTPEKLLGQLEKGLNTTFKQARMSLESAHPLKVGHRVGGNRIRFQQDLFFKKGLPELPTLNWSQEVIFNSISGSLSRYFRYS